MDEKLTVVILTHNEEQHISRCIDSIVCGAKILIIDSFSTDNTVAIAESKGAAVVQRKMSAGFAEQRNFALQSVGTPWIIYLDADERMTEELCESVIEIVEKEAIDAVYAVERVNYAFGERVRYGEFGGDSVVRFFHRGCAVWEGLVHERLITELPQRTLNGVLIHHTYISWERYFDKFNKYTTMMARKNYDNGKRSNFLKIVVSPPWSFFRAYFLRLGFIDGRIGFLLAAFHLFYTMAKYVKLYYLDKENGEAE